MLSDEQYFSPLRSMTGCHCASTLHKCAMMAPCFGHLRSPLPLHSVQGATRCGELRRTDPDTLSETKIRNPTLPPLIKGRKRNAQSARLPRREERSSQRQNYAGVPAAQRHDVVGYGYLHFPLMRKASRMTTKRNVTQEWVTYACVIPLERGGENVHRDPLVEGRI